MEAYRIPGRSNAVFGMEAYRLITTRCCKEPGEMDKDHEEFRGA